MTITGQFEGTLGAQQQDKITYTNLLKPQKRDEEDVQGWGDCIKVNVSCDRRSVDDWKAVLLYIVNNNGGEHEREDTEVV